LKEAIGIILMA
jgi:hypothetical protein